MGTVMIRITTFIKKNKKILRCTYSWIQVENVARISSSNKEKKKKKKRKERITVYPSICLNHNFLSPKCNNRFKYIWELYNNNLA
jgi:hypothetical protein